MSFSPLVDSGQDDATSGLATASFTMDVVAGQGVVVMMTWAGNSVSVSSMTANGEAMTACGAAVYSGTVSSQMYYLESAASTQSNATIQMVLSGNTARAVFGFSLPAPFEVDDYDSASGTSTTAAVGLTTTDASDAIFAVAVGNFAGNWVPDTGYTDVVMTDYSVYVGGEYDLDVGSAGAKTVQMTSAGSQGWTILALAIKSPSNPDVTVNLTGQSLTAAQGSVAAAISAALSGLAATISGGTISRSGVPTISGQSVTASAGSVSAARSIGISGQSASSSAGTLVASKAVAVAGQSSSISHGTITADAQSYIVVVGTPDPTSAYRITATPDISSGDWIQYRGVGGGAPPTGLVILTDATWYFTVGNYPANFDVRVSDNGGTTWGSWATQSIGVWVSLTGQSVTASAGTIIAAISKALTGQSVAISQGTVSAGSNLTVALTGQSMSASQGAMAYSAALALVGSALAASQGSITANAGSNVTVNLTGQAMTAALGTLSPAKQVTLTGQSASSAAGTLTVALARTLSGQSVPVSQGTVAVVRALTLLGIPCTVSQGSITAQAGGNVTVDLTGIAIALTGGTVVPSIGAFLAGAELSITSGFVGSNPQPPPTPSGPPNPIPAGGYASQNTPSVMLSTEDPATLRVGAGGCKLGRFAWADAGGLVGNQVELRLGFAVLQQQYWYSGYWAAGTFVLREGAPISLLSTGDVWAQFPAGAIPGDRVYARVLDGTAVSGYAAGCQATPWYVVTAAPAGGLAIISTTSRVQ